jgi:hypothetical protein
MGQSMADGSQLGNSEPTRLLRQEERELILSLLAQVSNNLAIESALSECKVKDMHDGGMGSIRFIRPNASSFGKGLVEARYTDSDGVLVSIALNIDKSGELYELDFWKIDFSPLRRYPTLPDLIVKGPAGPG